MKSRVIISVIAFTCLIASTSFSFATVKVGFDGISNYKYCKYNNIAGSQFVDKLYAYIRGSSVVQNQFIHQEWRAKESDISNGKANTVNFFVYVGHGIRDDEKNAAHFYARNSTKSHNTKQEKNGDVNATTNEARFGHGNLKWVAMYTCNWLNYEGNKNKKSNVLKQLEGARMIMGFGTTMYVDSREGKMLGYNLNTKKKTFKKAFVSAAKKYQPQKNKGAGDTKCRIVGWSSAKSDKLTSNVKCLSSANWYKNNKNKYEHIVNITITVNGKKI